MFGFGHRVYKNFDPRANVIRRVAEEVFSLVGRDPLIDVAVALRRLRRPVLRPTQTLPQRGFLQRTRLPRHGIPPEYFTVLFAVPRAAGYLAHWRESLMDPDQKIMRPQQIYQGAWLRDYPDIATPTARQRRSDVAGGTIERVEETRGPEHPRRGSAEAARGRLARSRAPPLEGTDSDPRSARRSSRGRDERRGRARSARVKRRDDPSRRAFA